MSYEAARDLAEETHALLTLDSSTVKPALSLTLVNGFRIVLRNPRVRGTTVSGFVGERPKPRETRSVYSLEHIIGVGLASSRS